MKKAILLVCTLGYVLVLSVSGGYAEETKNVDLEKIVVTPSRMEQYDYNAGSNITVIGKEEIESSNASHVSDILKERAGVNVYDSSTVKTAKIDIRGFADTSVSNVLVLINGRKVNSIDISGPDWLNIPLETVERIEIVRGAGSVLYGDNAVGGVINIITKKGEGEPYVKLAAKYGSYDMEQEAIEVSGSLDSLSYYLYSKYFETEGYRSNSDVLAKDLNVAIANQVSDDFSWDITAGWHEDDYGMPGGLLDTGELDQYGRRGSVDDGDFASTKDRYINLSFETEPYLKGVDLGNITTDFSYRNRDVYSWFSYGGTWPTGTKYMIDTLGINIKDVFNIGFFGKELSIVSGIDYYDVEHIIKGSENNSDNLTIYKEELGLYTYCDYDLFNKVSISSGARYQKAKYRFDQRASSVVYETREPSESVFMGGIKYDYADGSNISFNVQETFRFLATDEWYSTALPPTYTGGLDTNLKQQTGMQYEAGVKHKLNDNLAFDFTSYVIDLKDEIFVNIAPYGNDNYSKTRRKGVELGFSADVLRVLYAPPLCLDKLDFRANYTYQKAEFNGGNYGGNQIPMVPRSLFNLNLAAGLFSGYELSLNGRYIGKRYAINDLRHETTPVKDYFIMDGKLSYGKDALEVYGGINNIFGEKYYTYVVKSSSATRKDYYPAPERNFEVGLRYQF